MAAPHDLQVKLKPKARWMAENSNGQYQPVVGALVEIELRLI
jgi:hypothetical protein